MLPTEHAACGLPWMNSTTYCGRTLVEWQSDGHAVRRRVENARLDYDRLISENVFGYEKDGGDNYRVVNKGTSKIPKWRV